MSKFKFQKRSLGFELEGSTKVDGIKVEASCRREAAVSAVLEIEDVCITQLSEIEKLADFLNEFLAAAKAEISK